MTSSVGFYVYVHINSQTSEARSAPVIVDEDGKAIMGFIPDQLRRLNQ